MKRKGVSMLQKAMMAVIIGAVMMWFFVAEATEAGSGTAYLVNFYATDIGLIVETMQAVPGDVEIYYPLKPGFIVTMSKQRIKVEHESANSEGIWTLRTTPDITIDEQEAQGYLAISKIGGAISIVEDEEQSMCPRPATIDPLTVRVIANGVEEGSVLSEEDLDLIKESFDSALESAGVDTQGSPTMTVVIAADNEGSNTITLIHEEADGFIQKNYEYIYCDFRHKLLDSPMSVDTDIEEGEAHYHITMVFDPESRVDMIRDRYDYAQTLAETLASMGVSP